MPPAKNYAFYSLTEDGNVNPNLDSPESNLGYLQTLQFSIGQILVKLLRGEKKGENLKNKKKKERKKEKQARGQESVAC